MADEKTSDYILETNPTGKLLLDLANPADKNYKAKLGDNPADTFNTTSKTIMGSVNELESTKVTKTGTETITGNKTFTDNIYGQQTITTKNLYAGYTGQNGSIVLKSSDGVPVIILDVQTSTYELPHFYALGGIDLNSQRIIDLSDPINPQDAASKNYVDSNQVNVYYFGNNGSNLSDGTSLQTRKLDANGAIVDALAQASPPSADNRVSIVCTDGGPQSKFTLSGGDGFIAVDAETTGFTIPITALSPDGIKIDAGYTFNGGYVKSDAASTQGGNLIKCLAGVSATYLKLNQVFSTGLIDHTLIYSEGSKVLSDIADIRQASNRDADALEVASGSYRLSSNKRLEGKVSVGANAKLTIIDGGEWSGDIFIGINAIVDIKMQKTWDGRILNAGAGSVVTIDSPRTNTNDINIAATATVIFPKQVHDMAASTATIIPPAITLDVTGTKFNVAAGGVARIVDDYTNPKNPTITEVSIPSQSDVPITYLGVAPVTFLKIDKDQVVTQDFQGSTSADRKRKAAFGFLEHIGSAVVNTWGSITQGNAEAGLASDLGYALGYIKISGGLIRPNGTDMQIQLTAGEAVIGGANLESSIEKQNYIDWDDVIPIATISYTFRLAGGGFGYHAISSPATIAADKLDDGTATSWATLQTVAPNNWTNQRIYAYVDPVTRVAYIYIHVGQKLTYPTYNDAVTFLPQEGTTFVVNPAIQFGMYLSDLTVVSGATDLSKGYGSLPAPQALIKPRYKTETGYLL